MSDPKEAKVARLVGPLAERATRVIDIGCGHGHLARTLAARIGRPLLGLERDAAIAHRARVLAGRPDVVFDVTDVRNRRACVCRGRLAYASFTFEPTP